MSVERPLPPLRALCVFEAVYRLGSTRRASDELSIDTTVASRHLRLLQDWLGVRLLETSPKGVTLTTEGLRYAEQISPLLSEIAHATAQLRGRGRRPLRIWCVPGFATHWLIPRLPAFYERHPSIDLSLRPTEALPDFRNGEAVAKIDYGSSVAAGCKADVIARPAVYAVASPSWIASHPEVGAAADLATAQLIHEDSHQAWRDWFAALGLRSPPLAGTRLWNASAAMEAAVLGQGAILANELIAGRALASGQLRKIVDDAPILDPYLLVTLPNGPRDSAFTAFRTWLIETLRQTDRESIEPPDAENT